MKPTTWNELIEKIAAFKASKVKMGLNAPSILRLLYGGAFDSMLPPEVFKLPAHQRYARLGQEILHAMGSKAKLPKKGSQELIGLSSVASPGHLMLWRHAVNPFARYEITDYHVTFLKSLGFERPSEEEKRLDPGRWWVRYPKEGTAYRTRVEIRSSWASIFHPVIFRKYEDGKILVGVFGIITKSSKRMFQETKESLSVSLFNGHEYTSEMKMWPGPDGKLDRAKTAQMDELETGLAVIRPKFWNLRPTATLITWDRVWEIV